MLKVNCSLPEAMRPHLRRQLKAITHESLALLASHSQFVKSMDDIRELIHLEEIRSQAVRHAKQKTLVFYSVSLLRSNLAAARACLTPNILPLFNGGCGCENRYTSSGSQSARGKRPDGLCSMPSLQRRKPAVLMSLLKVDSILSAKPAPE